MEKVKEIKEALELNKYFAIEYFSKSGEPKIFTFTDLLTLINELESENEKLLNEKWDKEDDLDNYHEENQQLKARIAELETKNEVLCVELSRYTEHCVEMKNGTLKQFAERLFEKFSYDPLTHEPDEDIEIHLTASELDETLKEFTDGKV